MNMTMLLLTLLDIVAVVILLLVMFKFYQGKKLMRRIGILLLMLGVAYQAWQSFFIVLTGLLPIYDEMPLWMLKDIGILALGIGYWCDYRSDGRSDPYV